MITGLVQLTLESCSQMLGKDTVLEVNNLITYTEYNTLTFSNSVQNYANIYRIPTPKAQQHETDVSRIPRRDHITPVLRTLCWLPIH